MAALTPDSEQTLTLYRLLDLGQIDAVIVELLQPDQGFMSHVLVGMREWGAEAAKPHWGAGPRLVAESAPRSDDRSGLCMAVRHHVDSFPFLGRIAIGQSTKLSVSFPSVIVDCDMLILNAPR